MEFVVEKVAIHQVNKTLLQMKKTSLKTAQYPKVFLSISNSISQTSSLQLPNAKANGLKHVPWLIHIFYENDPS